MLGLYLKGCKDSESPLKIGLQIWCIEMICAIFLKNSEKYSKFVGNKDLRRIIFCIILIFRNGISIVEYESGNIGQDRHPHPA